MTHHEFYVWPSQSLLFIHWSIYVSWPKWLDTHMTFLPCIVVDYKVGTYTEDDKCYYNFFSIVWKVVFYIKCLPPWFWGFGVGVLIKPYFCLCEMRVRIHRLLFMFLLIFLSIMITLLCEHILLPLFIIFLSLIFTHLLLFGFLLSLLKHWACISILRF